VENKTELQIGPLTFTHQVQKINIQERKAISAIEATRSNKNFIVDSGDSEAKAQIRLLFTGLDEINDTNQDRDKNGFFISGLRALIALFKCCPIVTIKNNYLSSSWKKADKIYNQSNYEKLKQYLEEVSAINREIKIPINRKTILSYQSIDSLTDFIAINNNEYIVQTLNNRIKDAKLQVTPDILNDIGNFTDYSFGSVNFPDSFLQQNITYSENISVALESLELENVPDIPYSIQATLTIARIDTAPFTIGGELEYLGSRGIEDKKTDPKDAVWLVKWIGILLTNGQIPELTENDFKTASFSWYGKTAINTNITSPGPDDFKLGIGTHSSPNDPEKDALLISENSSLRHRFAYNKIIGKIYPTAAHMGSSGRYMSMDIVFNNQNTDETYKKFCKFKYTSDEINKERERFDRVTGWEIDTPISKLLSSPKNPTTQQNSRVTPHGGVYVPISIITETGDLPEMINCRIDMIENNIDFYSDNEIVLSDGSGTEFSKLKTYFDKLTEQEFTFRKELVKDRQGVANKIYKGDMPQYYSFNTFWPIEKGYTELKDESSFGILNIDTLRATILELDSDKFGGNNKLREALYKSPLSSGALFANRRPSFIDITSQNFSFLMNSFLGDEVATNPAARDIYKEVYDIVTNKVFANLPSGQSRDNIIKNFSGLITIGFLGDRTNGIFFNNSTTGKAITEIVKSNPSLQFHDSFKQALLNVLVQRRPKPKGLPYIYSTDGVYSAFFKLILSYSLEKDKTEDPASDKTDILRRNVNRGRESVYPDLLLPTYRQLYESRWEEFAPTIEDLGIVIPVEDKPGAPPDKVLAVSENDYVSPACWFYTKRNKDDLRKALKNQVTAVIQASPGLSISVPFNVSDIKELEEQIKAKKGAPQGSPEYDRADKSIANTITQAFVKYSTNNPSGFREDVANILTSGEKFEKLINTNNKILIHFKNNGNYAIPREINVPGIGAEIYKVVKNGKLLVAGQPGLLDPNIEATYVTPLNKEAVFLRGSKNATEACLNSSLSQIPDDHSSPERMFPAIKVYLLDKRGNDIIADDTLFNVNAIVSVDITMDKDDAPVAVIRLADPLYFLQNSYFDEKNVLYGKDTTNTQTIDRVFNTLKGADKDSFLKRYKIAQGRSVQIRMGYSSMPANLPIVFTGRIAEISPGDELVLVCQGWKAELINRKVNFVNDDAKNWGARDLALQTIAYANPEGFGEFFPEHDAQFILKNMDSADIETMLGNIQRNNENVDLENHGSRDISEGISNWLSMFFVGRSNEDRKNKGLDTRFKNIWYPDTQLYSNVLGIRSLFQVMPSWINDSWIVPLQPAWDVLKEASRHAWNCVVDVVPYDGEATIFMGHPDQPYYYTRGDSYSRKGFKKYSKETKSKFDEGISKLIDKFLSSFYYNNTQQLGQSVFYSNDSIASLVNSIALAQTEYQLRRKTYTKQVEFNSLLPSIEAGISASLGILYSPSLKYFALNYTNKAPISIGVLGSTVDTVLENSGINSNSRNIAVALFNKSKIPTSKLKEVITQKKIPESIITYLFAIFYGIEIETVSRNWINIATELPNLLDNIDVGLENFEIVSKLNTLYLPPNIEAVEAGQRSENLTPAQAVKLLDSVEVSIVNETATRLGLQKYTSVLEVREVLIDSSSPVLFRRSLLTVGFKRTIESILIETSRLLESFAKTFTQDSNALYILYSQIKDSYKNISNINIVYKKDVLNVLNTIDTAKTILKNKPLGTFVKNSILDKLGVTVKDESFIVNNLTLFKAFVYYFCSFLLEDSTNTPQIQNLVSEYDKTQLPPNMKVFRVHHFADDTHNILANNIVASTAEMWNTVVVEHPSPGSAKNTFEQDMVYEKGTLSAGVTWQYWPKQEVTGVIGLQFHPGLTLANKKIKVFTELNCQTQDLAAKIACVHLADGIKKMYRGNLALLGKHIKPHDRIILADNYTKMVGPVEVESVVHHWNVNQGWVTNILPNAVCDANPASSVLQTAAMEATFQSVFNAIDFFSDVVTTAIIVGTLGAGTPLALGAFSVRKAAKNLIKDTFSKQIVRNTLNRYKRNLNRIGRGFAKDWRKGSGFWSRVGLIKTAFREFGGPVVSLLANEVTASTATYGASLFYKHSAIASYVEIGSSAEQLPVVMTPLLFNGNPFTAGLETEDNVWAIGSFGLYYSMKELQAGASRFLEDFVEED
jgi:hypothetical protein